MIATKLNYCSLHQAMISPSLQLGLSGAEHFLARWQVQVSQLQCSPSTRLNQSLGTGLFCLVVYFRYSGLRNCLGWSPSLTDVSWWESFLTDTEGFLSQHCLHLYHITKYGWNSLLNAFPLTSVMTGKYCFVKHILISQQFQLSFSTVCIALFSIFLYKVRVVPPDVVLSCDKEATFRHGVTPVFRGRLYQLWTFWGQPVKIPLHSIQPGSRSAVCLGWHPCQILCERMGVNTFANVPKMYKCTQPKLYNMRLGLRVPQRNRIPQWLNQQTYIPLSRWHSGNRPRMKPLNTAPWKMEEQLHKK